jgi:hypothetical protein
VEVTQLQLLADNSLADIISKFSEIPQDSGMIKRTEVPGTRSTGDSAFMDELVQKFTNSISHLPKNPLLDLQKTQAHTVLLTGSTGTLGCHLLAHLLARDDVWHVYALNRGSDGHVLEERQTVALQAQGLSPALAHSEKLTLLVGDLGAAELGISSEKFHEVRGSAFVMQCRLILDSFTLRLRTLYTMVSL